MHKTLRKLAGSAIALTGFIASATSAETLNFTSVGAGDGYNADVVDINLPAAIWDVKYGNVTINKGYTGYSLASDKHIDNYYNAYTSLTYTASSYGEGLNGLNGVPSKVNGIPEVSTWAMMLTGFAALGFSGHRRPKSKRFGGSIA